ncbi:hypothetical protein F511_35390 [Dorcoceras hygrometricum]|uniref:Uncharacterized protein n=1 Tax=Dorcoceras hygrometricum TaxID=472368 RepID=A0A2Z7ABK9_9LAMI|nr:hypothetical protein F511_35390 [Dorcoceras hygrometricum]
MSAREDAANFGAKLLTARYCSGVNAGQPYCSSLLVDLESAKVIVRLNEEATRVSQHFGVLTIGFSSCASVERPVAQDVSRYDDVDVTYSFLLTVDCVVMVAAGSRRAYARV